ncbi:MAG: ribulose-phosphate 3-epimerase [Bacteroidetes bacterium]|nr:ribulose-phosphate 3-epimerase [Bacteroidota bacterium]
MHHPLKLAPSLLSADFANLERDVRLCETAGADILHIDVMDGHFVPNITIGPLIVRAIRSKTSLPFDCHLMIENPDRYIPAFAEAGADWISVHVEECKHLHRTLGLIHELGKKAGIVLNPATPLEFAYSAAEHCDFILLMSVNPGFGGQSFIPSFLHRCNTLRTHLDTHGLAHVEIEVDGGVKIDNSAQIYYAGANILVSGSGLFSGDLKENMRLMRCQSESITI